MAPVRHDHFLTMDQAIMRLETGWFTPRGDDTGYDNHPLPMPEFFAGLDVCGDPGTFIDLGCGIGTKCLAAFLRGWTVTGVERHADYADAARRLVPEATILTADVRDIDLSTCDVVYSYRLMVDLDAQHELNRWVLSHMRPGALYFCAGSNCDGYAEHVADQVWLAS